MRNMAMRATVALALSLGVVPHVAAAPPQTVEGTILAGNPVVMVGPGVNEVSRAAPQGIDGVWIALSKTASGKEPVTLAFASPAPAADLEVHFYDASGRLIQYYGCATQAPRESCNAPAGATHAVVVGYSGLSVSFTFAYAP